MAVNTLVTGLIVFKILKVFLEVKATSVEQTLGSLSSIGNTKLQHIIFVIIESGMALFAIQLVRILLTGLSLVAETSMINLIIALNVVVAVHEMLNVIIRSVHFYLFFLLITFTTWLGHCTNNNFGAGLNEIVL